MNYNREELQSMNNILSYCYVNNRTFPKGEELEIITGLNSDENIYLFNQVCIIGDNIGLFVMEHLGISYRVVSFNKRNVAVERFLRDGGFENHFKANEVTPPVIQTIVNHGSIGNLNQGKIIHHEENIENSHQILSSENEGKNGIDAPKKEKFIKRFVDETWKQAIVFLFVLLAAYIVYKLGWK